MIIVCTFILLIIDLGLTTYYLYHYYGVVAEGNLLFYNSDYGYLVFVLNFFYLIKIYITSSIYTRYQTVVIESEGTFDYIKQIYKSEHSKFILVNFSFTFIISTFISRLTAIVDWVIFEFYKVRYFDTLYAKIRSVMPMERYDVITGINAGCIAIPLWFYLEYLKSKKILDTTH